MASMHTAAQSALPASPPAGRHRAIGDGVTPPGQPVLRPQLCMLAQPCLRQPQQADDYRFFDATLLLVRSGRLSLDNGAERLSADGPDAMVAVAQDARADLQKTPGGDEPTFRSQFLTFAPEVIEEFYQRYEQDSGPPPALSFCRAIGMDADLGATFQHCLRGIASVPVSDRVLRHRLLELLLALAERGLYFARPARHSVSKRLTSLLTDAPGEPWTAAKASARLAMSEATLRRRLVAENVRFEALLLEVRMHHGMALLQTTGWGVRQIAEACGYLASARFSLRFRERFGCAPSQVR
jgi:AraC-like DNA-binding protein